MREELLFGFRAQGRADAEAEVKVDAMIERFGFDGDAEPFLLNRGTRQLLALASIIVMEPPVVVLDEPTTGLDFRECAKVMDVIAELNARGTTVVMVCHDMEVVADYAKRVIAMTAGQVVADGETFAVLRDRDVLEVAPPADRGDRARGEHPVRARLDDGHGVRERVALGQGGHDDVDDLAGQGVPDEQHPAVHAGHPVAAVGHAAHGHPVEAVPDHPGGRSRGISHRSALLSGRCRCPGDATRRRRCARPARWRSARRRAGRARRW